MSAAREFIQDRNRTTRFTTAKKDSLEHQVAVDEQWIVNEANAINEKVNAIRQAGDATEQKIAKERTALIEAFDKEAQKRIDNVTQRVIGFDSGFALPEQPAHVTQMLIQHFMTSAERSTLLRDAITGKNQELALALLHAPQTMTELSPDARQTMTRHFMSEADQVKQERRIDLEYRGRAVVETYETTKRKLGR
ncbi:MAG: hypothetical protein DRI30_02645 [Chloroflexi bacterium]|nr:MAG: hypothetical protein DRI30_02645 [Chloroflexota bacterium]